MTGLAAAYHDRIHGNSAENIDSAIATYEQVLATIPQHRQPVIWAMVANHLAAAYGDRPWGDRLDNIDVAISTYQQGFVKFC